MRAWPSRKRDGDDALFVFCEQKWPVRVRRFNRAIPSSPRCKLCRSPFGGLGRILPGPKFSPSRKNPNFCKSCFEQAPVDCRELEVGVLFADVRGYTALSESLPSDEVVELMNRFYALATDVLVRHDAVIDKLIGDEVMALFIPAWTPGAIPQMVRAAEELVCGVGFGSGEEPWLPLGVGLDCGVASVGNVGIGEVKDFTAIGEVVNTAARLQACAQAGQLVVSERVRRMVPGEWPASETVEFELKGKAEPVRACVISPGISTGARGLRSPGR
jgi:adenylate cyclase